MRKICVSIIAGFIVFSAFGAGENVPTSKSYIDSVLVEKQDTIERATGNNQALTNTGTAGEYGTKDIYDSTGEYAAQQNALVDAQTMNTAVQNAINAEFVCISWVDDDPTKDCLLMEIRGVTATGATTLPSGYTALEYIESTGTQYINTGEWIEKDKTAKLELSVQLSPHDGSNDSWMGANAFLQLRVTQSYYAVTSGTALAANMNQNGSDSIIMDYDTKHLLSLYVNGNYIQRANWDTLDQPRSALCIFSLGSYRGGCGGSTVKGKVYAAKLSIDNDLKRDLIPARRDSDGEIGMYDLVSRTFFTNSGTGEFIAGPVVNLYLPSGD